jgi:acyl-CoA thioester hydrolase
MLWAEAATKAEFYDLDPMQMVWHGNYPRFLELGRNALLDRIGYGYAEMVATGWSFPVVEMRIKYLRSIYLNQRFLVRAGLVEWENRLVVDYQLVDGASGALLSKARTTQVAVNVLSGELSFVSPPELVAGALRALAAEPA